MAACDHGRRLGRRSGSGRAAAEPGGRRWTPGETALFTATASTCLWTGFGLATAWLIPLLGA